MLTTQDIFIKRVLIDGKRTGICMAEGDYCASQAYKIPRAELKLCEKEKLLSDSLHGVNLPHSGRFALVSFLHTIGMDSEQILTLFAQSPDFDESKSSYQIKHITGELNNTDGYTPPECHTMKTNGLCPGEDPLCEKEWMNHPLIYYRVKTEKKQ